MVIRSKDVYIKEKQVGEGTFGKVYKAKCKETGTLVALKKIRMDNEREGFPVTAVRELKLLQSLSSDFVVKMIEIVTSRKAVFVVFEYMEFDLNGYVNQITCLEESHLKCLMVQMLESVKYLHSQNIVHRDIKGSNFLLNRKGKLKLADFGLAKKIHTSKCLTNRVITIWYRPPELLLGSTSYGTEIDIWSLGCVFIELFYLKPPFNGIDEVQQLESIFKLVSKSDWPQMQSLEWFPLFNIPDAKSTLRKTFKRIPSMAMDLIEKMIRLDPTQRVSAEDALNDVYFETYVAEPSDLPFPDQEWHEFEVKKKRKEEIEKANK